MSPVSDEGAHACIILGGGGHARVVIDCLDSAEGRLHGVLDQDARRWGTTLQGVPILGGDDLLPSLARQGVDRFVVGLGGTGDNRPRQKLFEFALACGLSPVAVIHRAAIVSRWAVTGAGAQLFPGSIVNAGAELGVNVIVNTGSIVEHDCRIADHVHVASGAVVAATVRIGLRAHIGAGATIRQGIVIGDDAVVGAGAVVVKDVAPGQVVAGVPARPLSR